MKNTLRNATLLGVVALVAACKGDEADPRYVGKFYSPSVVVDIEYVEEGKYLAAYKEFNSWAGSWSDVGVLDAEVVNGKFFIDWGGQKKHWSFSDDGLLIDFPDKSIHDALRIPNDWDRRMAKRYMPNWEAWKAAIDDPKSWKLKLKEEAGVEVGI